MSHVSPELEKLLEAAAEAHRQQVAAVAAADAATAARQRAEQVANVLEMQEWLAERIPLPYVEYVSGVYPLWSLAPVLDLELPGCFPVAIVLARGTNPPETISVAYYRVPLAAWVDREWLSIEYSDWTRYDDLQTAVGAAQALGQQHLPRLEAELVQANSEAEPADEAPQPVNLADWLEEQIDSLTAPKPAAVTQQMGVVAQMTIARSLLGIEDTLLGIFSSLEER